MLARFARVIPVVLAVCASVAACGSRASLEDPDIYLSLDGSILPDGAIPNTCGNGTCEPTESCTNCSVDCGLCKGCGDGVCQSTETCSSCPQDCGKCAECGNGFCTNGKTCLSCAPDCGPCAGCGDGKCDATKNENCFTCPADCGACTGCGNGICNNGKTCASCQHDCGVCSFCGNNKCEPFETCSNCPKDCGACTTKSCFQAFTCSIGCIKLNSNPPQVSISCVANCLAQGCADTQFFFDQAFNCAVFKGIAQCKGPDINCLQKVCGPEIAACLGATCPN